MTYVQPDGVVGATGDAVPVSVDKGTDYTLLARTAAEFAAWGTPDGQEFKGWKRLGAATDEFVTKYHVDGEVTFVAVYEPQDGQDEEFNLYVRYHQYKDGIDTAYEGSMVEYTLENVKYGDTITLESWDNVVAEAEKDTYGVAWTKPSKMRFNGWSKYTPAIALAATDEDNTLYAGGASYTITKENVVSQGDGYYAIDFEANYKKKSSTAAAMP